MAQDVQVKATCDADGCRKQLGETNDHIVLSLTHKIAHRDTPEGAGELPPVVSGQVLDFCSYEHAGDYLRGLTRPLAERRAAMIESAVPPPEPEEETAEPSEEEPAET